MSIVVKPGSKPFKVGQDRVLAELKKYVLSEGTDYRVCGVTGKGGAGKTVLVNSLVANADVKDRFNGCVYTYEYVVNIAPGTAPPYMVERQGSGGADTLRAQKGLLQSCRSGKAVNADRKDPLPTDEVAEELHKSSAGSAFLLVLDNIWVEDDVVKTLGLDFMRKAPRGSMCVMLSRNRDVLRSLGVAHTVHVGLLRQHNPGFVCLVFFLLAVVVVVLGSYGISRLTRSSSTGSGYYVGFVP